jgi:hypothetical protein
MTSELDVLTSKTETGDIWILQGGDRIMLSDELAFALAYKLMSLAAGQGPVILEVLQPKKKPFRGRHVKGAK